MLPHIDETAVEKLASAKLKIKVNAADHKSHQQRSLAMAGIANLPELLMAYDADVAATRQMLDGIVGSQFVMQVRG